MTVLHNWLQQHADTLDQEQHLADELMPALAAAGRFRVGVPAALGGDDGSVGDAICAIADVAEHSLTAAFVYWGQRTFIEYLLQSPNTALCERLMPQLLEGRLAGATGLSNAMKFLSGMEALQITAAAGESKDTWQLNGQLAWVTNLHPAHFVAAAAVAPTGGDAPMIVVFDSKTSGVRRSANLDLIAMCSSHTASVKLDQVVVNVDDVISVDAPAWLPQVRPAFLGMQCGMSVGLARVSLKVAAALAGGKRGQLSERITEAQALLAQQLAALLEGVADGRFVRQAAELFRLRIALAESVQQAMMLELQAKGGQAYLLDQQRGFGRRWRESAFIPVITPSLTQLQAALAQQKSVYS